MYAFYIVCTFIFSETTDNILSTVNQDFEIIGSLKNTGNSILI